MSTSTTCTDSPFSVAARLVSPTMATSGSVKMTCGTTVWSAEARHAGQVVGLAVGTRRDHVAGRAGLVLAHVREQARPLTSPTAYSQPPSTAGTRNVSSACT